MTNQLVIDGGATTCKPMLLTDAGTETWSGPSLPGLSPLSADEEEMVSSWGRCPLWRRGVGSVHYYGAGCIGGAANERVVRALRQLTGCNEIEVESDLVGACRGAAGRTAGVVLVLGTGMNSCCWDGERIVEQTPSLGFMIGDEGSGADIGRRLARLALRGEGHPELRRNVLQTLKADNVTEAVRSIYGSSHPNRLLASLAPLALEGQGGQPEGDYGDVVEASFCDLADGVLRPYLSSGWNVKPWYGVGGVAVAFRERLSACLASRLEVTLSSVVADPLLGLAQWHREMAG